MEAEAHKTALAQAALRGPSPARLRQPMGSIKATGNPPVAQALPRLGAHDALPPHRCRTAASPLRAESGVRSRAMRAATDATLGHGAQEELEARNKLLGQMMITAVEQQRAERLDLEEQRVRVEVESAS